MKTKKNIQSMCHKNALKKICSFFIIGEYVLIKDFDDFINVLIKDFKHLCMIMHYTTVEGNIFVDIVYKFLA